MCELPHALRRACFIVAHDVGTTYILAALVPSAGVPGSDIVSGGLVMGIPLSEPVGTMFARSLRQSSFRPAPPALLIVAIVLAAFTSSAEALPATCQLVHVAWRP